MYNYQTFLREQSLQKHIEAVKKDHHTSSLKRELSSPALVQAHKKRIEGFVLSVIDKPINVSQYKNQPPSFRISDDSAILGAKGFYIRRESQFQRIQNQLNKNSELDQVPFTNTYTHKFRQSSGKGMHYKSFTHSLRIKEFLDRQELNYLPNTAEKSDKLLKKQKRGEKVDLEKLNSSLNKNLLPMLHHKTYFKSLSTLFTEIPAKTEMVQVSVVNDEGVEQIQERRHLKPNDFINRKENSRDALIKCNMLKEKLRA